MTRIRGRCGVAAIALVASIGIAVPARAGMLDDLRDWMVEKLLRAVPKASAESKALQADLERYRAEARTMEPKKAAEGWLALYDRARKLGYDANLLWDVESRGPLGVGALLAALPAPEAWPALREGAKARAQKAPNETGALGLRLVTELLTADRKAAAATLAQIEARAKSANNEDLAAAVAHLRAEIARLYGTREEIAATFVASLDGHGAQQYSDVD